MNETDDSLNRKILNLQNALITQCIDQTKLKNDADDFSQRSDFYEDIYNRTKREFYELEVKYKNISRENETVEEKYQDLNQENKVLREKYQDLNQANEIYEKMIFSKNNINNLSSIELLKIVLKRLKAKIIGGKHEFN